MADLTRQDTIKEPIHNRGKELASIRLNPKNLIFYTAFLLVFCFSGIIAMVDIIPYRMAAVSLLAVPLFFKYGFKIDRVSIAFFILIFLIFISGFVNGIPIVQQSIFVASVLLSFFTYYLVRSFMTRQNAAKIMRLCVLIGMLQLPVILFQLLTYHYLPARLMSRVSQTDYDFGTFNLKTDYAMAFFLVLLIIFLLFDDQRNYVIKRRWLVIAWFSLSVLIANSEIMKLVLVGVWAVYLLRYLKFANVIRFGILFLFIGLILASSGVLNEVISDSINTVKSNFEFDEQDLEQFLAGGYGRRAAIAYYLNTEIKIFGDGPGAYFNRIERQKTLGNTGHIFSYYAEIGLLGWLATILIFFLIAFPGSKTRIRISLVGVLIFVSVQILSITAFIVDNISIMMIFTIVASSYLIPKKKDLLRASSHDLKNFSL